MASSIPSSPSSREQSPEQMTPRTKIRALLATVESSDEENGSQETKPQNSRSLLKALRKSPLPRPDEDDSDVEIRPRGRLAARMHAATTTKQPSTKPSDNDASMSLQSETASTEKIDEATQQAEQQQEEEELPVAPRQFKRLTNRASSPQTVERTERPTSPGLFVSSPIRPSPTKSIQNESASETELPPLKSDRFKALVERKRQERLAREAAEESRKAERRAQQEKLASELEQLQSDNEDNVSDITDDEGGRRLSQMARPTRKASRKAIEEMNQETQRMARNMQLAHEAKTRKKITKASLFERFNFKPAAGIQTEPKTTSSSRPGTPDSDVAMQDDQTPPSSPPTVGKVDAANGPNENATVSRIDAEAQEEVATGLVEAPVVVSRPKRQVRVRIPFKPTKSAAADSDDELEITRSAKDSIDAVFNSIPLKKARNTQSLQALQMLAHLRSPGRDSNPKHTGMSPGELQDYLQQKVRQQAKIERDRRLETLKAQGVVIHTMEERERQMQEVEDIVAKAREEAQKIMQQERAEAKKERLEKGGEDPLGWDDSEDEEYEASADEHEEGSGIELSGSEDEDEDADMDDEDGQDEQATTTDAEQKIDETTSICPTEEEDAELPTWHRRPRKQITIVSDDEAEVEATPRPKATVHMTPGTTKTTSPAFPTPVLRSAKKSFIPGLPVQGPAGLGLTQIFAGTMDDSQMSPAQGPTQSLMPDFDHFPDSNFSATAEVAVESMVLDSQREETQDSAQPIQLDLSQSQMRGLDSLLREESNTQISEMIEMSQDGGFQEHTPLKDRFLEVPTSTVDTVLANTQMDEASESPLARRGRLRRKMQSSALAMGDLVSSTNKTAFDALKNGTKELKKKELLEEFNRKKSKAKEMVEEQAEESEDEYAGLGGADGEDSDDDSLASVEEIIDDTTNAQADADKLAAFYMDRERANDEKEVEKLFKDVTTGMLRRKRGADYDLSDSDDGGEARRRMKRRQFAKMQKALFADERVKKMAENPGNQAFLRTIEDQGSDDEMSFLDAVEEPSMEGVESQSQTDPRASQERQTVHDEQRPPLNDSTENHHRNPRRTKGCKKPSNIGEVRETLSDLLEEPQGSLIPATEIDSDSDGEGRSPPPSSDKENLPMNTRRGRVAVVDRISLKRQSSSALSASNSKVAFAVSATSSSFKVPALLRRATTNSLISGSSGTTSSAPAANSGAGFGDDAKIKKTAGKRSGVNAFARENERRAKIQESERRREEKKVKDAKRRIGMVGGLLAKGSFE